MSEALLTIPMIKERLPDGGPSERWLREEAKRLGLGRRMGRCFYLTETDWQCLLAYASVENTGTPEGPSRPRKPMVQSGGSALKKALELSRRPKLAR